MSSRLMAELNNAALILLDVDDDNLPMIRTDV